MNKQSNPSSFVGALATLALVLGSVAMPAQAAEESGAPDVAAAHAATTDIHFDDIPVRSALQLIAEEAGFNLVVPDSVTGNITLHLKDVTWEQALDVVLRMKGLGMRVDNGSRSLTISDR